MHPRDLKIEEYNYDLPDERIAKYPLEVRDASKLLIYKNGSITEDTYSHISNHIPGGALMVFNQTRVVHARLLFQKSTGGVIEVFCLEPAAEYGDVQTAMLQKDQVLWKCLIGGAGKWKHGMVLELKHSDPDFVLSAAIADRGAGSFTLQLKWDDPSLTFAEVLHFVGKVPLPPYLHRNAEINDESRYQTIYARDEGSVAAPTAGLHFAERVMDSLAEKNIRADFVTLHVGAGTFMPVKSETMDGHIMHAEWIDVTREFIENLIAHLDNAIVAVGTTSMRTLESLYWIGVKIIQGKTDDLRSIAITQWDAYETESNIPTVEALQAIISYLDDKNISRLITRTQILIAPGYRFRLAKGLVTNFHQPQSTLLLLVSAFTNGQWRQVYEYALVNDYRFLSYGDGCLFWNE